MSTQEVALRRAIALIERLLPYVVWDGLDGEEEEARARVTLELLQEALAENGERK